MFPCIQTLGHLGQILQWPAYHKLRDTSEVLLALDERTYSFIEKMIKAASSCFRSKKIHVGMDEVKNLERNERKGNIVIQRCLFAFRRMA
jgi:hexosaminidase